MFAVTPRKEHTKRIGRSESRGRAWRPWIRNAAPRRLADPNTIRHAVIENGVKAPGSKAIFPNTGKSANSTWTAARATWPLRSFGGMRRRDSVSQRRAESTAPFTRSLPCAKLSREPHARLPETLAQALDAARRAHGPVPAPLGHAPQSAHGRGDGAPRARDAGLGQHRRLHRRAQGRAEARVRATVPVRDR